MNSKSIEKNEKLKQGFENLKSNFIFKKIFNIMRKNRTLEIVKYNKILQKRLNLSIRDYKAYYSSIEIELKLADNQYGKFINISHEYKDYYHIYFNNSTEEEDKINIDEDDNVQSIKIKIDYKIISFLRNFLKYIDSMHSQSSNKLNNDLIL